MGTKFTKGPWKVLQPSSKDGSILIQSESEVLVAYASDNMTESREESEANARLIAASPDMLEALMEVKRIGEFKGDSKIGAILNNAIRKATSAE